MNHLLILDVALVLHSKVINSWSFKVLMSKSFTQQSGNQRQHNRSKGFHLVTRSAKRGLKWVCVVSRLPLNTHISMSISTRPAWTSALLQMCSPTQQLLIHNKLRDTASISSSGAQGKSQCGFVHVQQRLCLTAGKNIGLMMNWLIINQALQ